MKTSVAASLIFLIAIGLRAQPAPVQQTAWPPADTDYSAVNRDAHNTVWEKTTYELTPSGQWFPHVQSFVETATGLNFFDASTGAWQPSMEDIELSPGGASAVQGQHKVIFAADLATTGAINLQMPDSQNLTTELIGLAYSDQASGQTVFIAIITNCVGQIVGSNQVWYQNAFAGLNASVHYTYTKAGFEQDVVLEECPSPPEKYGLNSATTVLQAVTEIESAPSAVVSTTQAALGASSQISDETIQFPTMMIGRGRAFLIGDSDSNSVAVSKQWAVWSGQQVLVEQIPMTEIASQLQTLPYSQTSAAEFSNSVINVVSAKRLHLNTPTAKRNVQPMRFASAKARGRGFVLDYNTLNTSQTNYVFQGDTTYYISGNVNLYGTNTVFEGGTVLKSTNGVTLTVNTPVTWQGKPYRPIVMTAKDDNSVGFSITGSTGNPGSNYYANVALNFDGTSALTNLSLTNLRILNAKTGVALNGQSGHILNDLQLVKCGKGIAATNTDFTLHNALFYLVPTNFSGSSATGKVEQLTSDTATWLNQSIGTNLFLTNCLLAAVTNLGNCFTDHVAWLSTNTGVFQTGLPGGLHYLPANSPYLTAGTTNISLATFAALQKKTTYSPVVYTNTMILVPTTFNAQAPRDTNTPAIGWHYDPMDWVFGGVLSNANLTFTAGTAVGWYRTTSGYRGYGQPMTGIGLNMSNTAVASFQGTMTSPDYWVRCNTVQEQDLSGGQGPGGITGSDDQNNANISLSAQVLLNFTKCTVMSGDQGNFFRDDWGYLIVQALNSEFDSGSVGGYVISGYFTNCLWDRNQGGQVEGHPGNQWIMRNCTLHGGELFMSRVTTYASIPVSVRDCSFDSTVFSLVDSLSGNHTYTDYNYDAYTNASNPFPLSSTNDVVMTNGFNWQTSWFGTYYLPTNSPLIDAGDITANLVGLYHFTTQTNQTIEGNSPVDIGYHYIATDSNGNPLDTNGDGTPDYLEDSNGDGIYDAGDLGNWLINPWNGLTLTNGLQVFTPLK